MTDCIFCKIANGTIPARLAHEGDRVIAFHDLNPQAPHHLLVVPRRHIATVNDLTDEETPLAGEMIDVARQLAVRLGVAESGYRLVLNCNQDGGQSVYHIHLHLLAGRGLRWPPG